MTANQSYVIVGASLAGAKAAEAMRDAGFDGSVVIVGDERELPYERPPLSKGYLLGKDAREKAFVHAEEWYGDHDVALRLGTTVTGLHRSAHEIELSGGERIAYDKLLLATGSSPRKLQAPGADLAGVHYLRRIGDSDALRETFAGGGSLVVVGAGWIGLEVAAAARHYGVDVTVLEPQPTPLHAVLGPEMGAVFARLHRDHGVDLFTDTVVREFRGSGGRVESVATDALAGLAADLVVVGIGATPNVDLAAAAGLEVDNGVVTDHALRTSAPDVFAAGDVASSFHPLFGRYVRVEHWANALNGGPAAARSMLGQDVVYDRVPYFFTDQYDLGMEYSGLGGPDDTVVVRGNPDGYEFIAFWQSGGRVVAGMNVNVWDVTEPIQALIRSGREVPAERLADPDVPLEDLLG